jgi:hypothetical protein
MVGYGLILFNACFCWATSQFFDKPQSYCCASIYHHIPDKFGAPYNWLAVWNMDFIFPYIGNNSPN